MTNEAELWAEYDRLLEADDFDDARKILDQIPPLSDEEWRRKLDEAPMDDEPLSARQRARLSEFEASYHRMEMAIVAKYAARYEGLGG